MPEVCVGNLSLSRQCQLLTLRYHSWNNVYSKVLQPDAWMERPHGVHKLRNFKMYYSISCRWNLKKAESRMRVLAFNIVFCKLETGFPALMIECDGPKS